MAAPDRRPWLLPGGITVLALALRLYRLDAYSIWADEAHSLQIGLAGVFTFQPPFFPLLVRTWLPLAGNDFLLRLLPALIGSAAVPAAWRLAREAIGRRGAVAAALLVALSPLGIYYSRELRMYGLMLLLGLLSWRALLANSRRGGGAPLAAYILATTLALYTHHYGLFLLAGQALALPWLARAGNRRPLLSGPLVTVLLYLPYLPTFLRTARRVSNAHYWPEPVSGWSVIKLLRVLSAGYEPPLPLVVPLVLGTLSLAILGGCRGSRDVRILLGFGLAAPAGMALVTSLLLPTSLFVPRYLIFLLGPLLVAAAAGTTALPGRMARTGLLGALLLLQAATLPYQYGNRFVGGSFREVQPRVDFRSAARFIQQHHRPGDAVGCTAESGAPSLWYYLDLRQGVGPVFILDLEGRWLRHSAELHGFPDLVDIWPATSLRELDSVVEGHRRLWLVGTQWDRHAGPDDPYVRHRARLRSWLEDRYPSRAHRRFDGVDLTLYQLKEP